MMPCWIKGGLCVYAGLKDRGIHHPNEGVRRRCFYLYTRFVKQCKLELDQEMLPPILNSMKVNASQRPADR